MTARFIWAAQLASRPTDRQPKILSALNKPIELVTERRREGARKSEVYRAEAERISAIINW